VCVCVDKCKQVQQWPSTSTMSRYTEVKERTNERKKIYRITNKNRWCCPIQRDERWLQVKITANVVFKIATNAFIKHPFSVPVSFLCYSQVHTGLRETSRALLSDTIDLSKEKLPSFQPVHSIWNWHTYMSTRSQQTLSGGVNGQSIIDIDCQAFLQSGIPRGHSV